MELFPVKDNVKPPFIEPQRPHAFFSIAKRAIKLGKHPVDVTRLGAKWRLHPRDWIDNRLIIGKPFEYDQLNYVFSQIEKRRIDMCLDCGANIGLYTVLLGIHAPKLREIIAFEPVPDTFLRLQNHILMNNLNAKVTPAPIALSNKSGFSKIQFTPKSSGIATLDAAASAQQNANFSHELRIETAPFDDIYAYRDRSCFVKIDVEGHAVPLLEGMKKFLSENTCLLQIETTNDSDAIESMLSQLGYRLENTIKEDHYYANHSFQ